MFLMAFAELSILKRCMMVFFCACHIAPDPNVFKLLQSNVVSLSWCS